MQNIPDQPLNIAKANHIGNAVKDLELSVKFYSALTGQNAKTSDTWSAPAMAKASGEEKIKVKWATISLQNLNIDLLQFLEPVTEPAKYKANQTGGMHFCFEVEDINAVYDRMKAAGIEFAGPSYTVAPEDAKEGVGTGVAYFDGPDGEHLEIIMPAGPFKIN